MITIERITDISRPVQIDQLRGSEFTGEALAHTFRVAVVDGVEPDLVYLPERNFSMESFLADVKAALEKKPNVVVAVSEGLRFADGRYVGEGAQSGAVDIFGHRYLAGTGKALEMAVKSRGEKWSMSCHISKQGFHSH